MKERILLNLLIYVNVFYLFFRFSLCLADVRLYGYVKFTTGDEMSKRQKFVFLSWCGEKVSPLKKAQVSTHRSIVKKYVQNFAIELQCYYQEDLNERAILSQLIKAGGANYGTGGR